jgi:hypothetical protein
MRAVLAMIAQGVIEDYGPGHGCGLLLTTSSGRRISSMGTDTTAERIATLYDTWADHPGWAAGRGLSTIWTGVEPHCLGWTNAAAELGARSSVTVPLHTGRRAIGALTLHGREPGAFGFADVHRLRVGAAAAAALIAEMQAESIANYPAPRR